MGDDATATGGTADLAVVDPVAVDPAGTARRSVGTPLRSVWRATWPKLLAITLFITAWQLVVLTGWRPPYALPGPPTVARELWDLVLVDPKFWPALVTTLRRAAVGFLFAATVGTVLGIAVARSRVLRAGVGSLITGLQTMPSITWFPLAILLFGISETAITFVVVLGAAPSIANGILSGIDHVPPAFTRLGAVLGAGGWRLYRYVVLPAALPSYVAGLNQGWAFAWRSLMAGELLVIVASRPSVGSRLSFSQEFGNAPQLIAYMLVILVVGMLADTAFTASARRMRSRRGLASD
ncbi:MAG: ABC transporter permease [Actinomycetales bacterium]|nr:ABC transporter permease [Actinomycetales bacterium]